MGAATGAAAAAAIRRAAPAAESTGRPGPPAGAAVGRFGAGRGAIEAACGAADAGAAESFSPGPRTRRVFTFSTTTCLERPWEKLWRTVPCSAGRFNDSVFEGTDNVFSPTLFGSLISYSVLRTVVRVFSVRVEPRVVAIALNLRATLISNG